MAAVRRRWIVAPPAPLDFLTRVKEFTPLIGKLLYNRGLTDPSAITAFLAPESAPESDPFLLPDIEPAVIRIERALLGGEQIAIYGDFDADGITATAILVKGLAKLGANVIPYIPHRLTEGYGLNHAALESLRNQGISLIISVDCGITAIAEAKRARKNGLDIIITDHHTPLEEYPPAVAVIDPKRRDSRYPFSELVGAGVAYKLLQALYRSLNRPLETEKYIDLTAIGTVADIAPLLSENRRIVTQGLQSLNTNPPLGVAALLGQARFAGGKIDSETISWLIAPRLNAAGRLAHAISSYKLLTTDVLDEAQELAAGLEERNTQRQQLTAKAFQQARLQIDAAALPPLLIAADNQFPPGVCGLVASRLADEFYRPAVVIKTGEGICSGSCRSIPEFNIINALGQCAHLLTRFGGHSQAAGFSIRTENLPQLQEILSKAAADQLRSVELYPRLDIDAEVTLDELAGNTFTTIQKLSPFGQGNPAPVFLSRRVRVADCRTMGTNRQHLRLKLSQNQQVWDAVGFNLAYMLPEMTPMMDFVYSLEKDSWNGHETIRLNLTDIAPVR